MPIEWPSATAPSVDGSDDDAAAASSLSYPSSEASYDSDDGDDDDDQHALIQEEWEESMRQLEMVCSVILLPFLGKWWGRKFAFWGESTTQGQGRAEPSRAESRAAGAGAITDSDTPACASS